MKKEIRKILLDVVKDEDAYKWSVTKDGLKWEYIDTPFTFKEGEGCIKIYDEHQKLFIFTTYSVDDSYDDAKNIFEAYKKSRSKHHKSPILILKNRCPQR